MPSSSDAFRYLTSLPGARPIAAYRETTNQSSPQQEVKRFESQVLGGLMSGTASGVGQQGNRMAQPRNEGPSMRSVQAITRGTNMAVRDSSQRQLQNAQIQRQNKVRRAKEEAERQRQSQYSMVRVGGRIVPTSTGQYQRYAPSAPAGGTAVNRIQSMLGRFPGLHITETLGNRAYDVAHGVARSPNSYHYDSGNPAVDIAGPSNQLWALYNTLKQVGGWRQILWQVPGHYDHIHVA